MEELVAKLKEIAAKAATLKEQQVAWQAKVEELENQHKADKEIISIQKNIISELENQLNKVTLASQIEEKDLEQKATLKRQVSEYIKEIDEIVDFLKMKA